jgi:Uma2 family endonuclease
MFILMTVVTSETRFTPEDLLELDSDLLYELVDGKLVEKKMSSLSSETAGIVASQLIVFLRKSLGRKVYPEQTFQCFPHDSALVRRPDVAIVAAQRLAGVAGEGHVRSRPIWRSK